MQSVTSQKGMTVGKPFQSPHERLSLSVYTLWDFSGRESTIEDETQMS